MIPIPLHDRITIERDLPETLSENGIILPSMKYDDKTMTGTVIAVGRDVVDVKVLDKVMFSKFCNDEIVVSDKKYLIIKECQVYGVVTL